MQAALNLGKKAFNIYIAFLNSKISIYLAYEAQIALVVAKKVNILIEYLDYFDIFFKKLAAKLHERFDINKHLINLKLSIQQLYGPIYSLEPIKLETFKMYIKTNLANEFTWPSKFLARVPIFFV